MRITTVLLILLTLLFWGCKDDNGGGMDLDLVDRMQVTVNPSGVSPLSALLTLETRSPVQVQLTVKGQNGPSSDVVQEFPDLAEVFELPVLGLYANTSNRVILTFYDANGMQLGTEETEINLGPLIPELPEIRINRSPQGSLKPGFNLVNYFGHNGSPRPQRPFMFDQFGDIRWYLDFSKHPSLSGLFIDNGINLLQNGNLVFGDQSTGAIYEIDRLGNIIDSWSLQGLGFHHHVIEKPNGNFVVTVSDLSTSTVEDIIIEIDRNTKEIVNRWDLNQSLDNSRRAWETNLADLNIDWFHANAVEYSPSDDCIIVSGRTQGTVKLTANNEVVWILAPHRDWHTAGNGQDLTQFLLQPLDATGQVITEAAVLDGQQDHPDFEWAWYQHSPILLPNGHLMIFDNGDNRNYQEQGFQGPNSYSRAVEYRIDEDNMTIQQVWDYGKARGQETYSRIVSKVSYHAAENHVLFTPGACIFGGQNYGKVIELDRQNSAVLFEATLTPPIPIFNITFHNVQRIPLY